MTNGGFVLHPEQEPQEEPNFEAKTETTPAPPAEEEGLDEVAIAELKALKEMASEQKGEQGFLEQASETRTPEAQAPGATAEPEIAVEQQDETFTRVEKILEEDLEDLVAGMNPEDKEKFEKKGLEVSGQIANMIRALKLKMEKAVSLIRDWLRTIPGVNKYFLEQAAKIKADKMMDLEEELRNDLQNTV